MPLNRSRCAVRGGPSPGCFPRAAAALNARLGRVETALAGATAPQPSAATPVTDADARVAALSARLDAAEAAIARLSAPPPPTAPQQAPVTANAVSGAGNARATALASLRRAVDSGTPYTAELDALAAFGSDPIISGLRPAAAAGIATRATLTTDFDKVGEAILTA